MKMCCFTAEHAEMLLRFFSAVSAVSAVNGFFTGLRHNRLASKGRSWEA